MFGLKKKQKMTVKTLVTDTASLLDDFMNSAESTDELLNRLGLSRKQVFDACSADEEIESCRLDLATGMTSAPWRLWGDDTDEDQVNRLYKVIRRHIPAFVEQVLIARFGGYAVAEYVYKQEADGFLTLDRIIDKSTELESYIPQRDGSLKFNSVDGEMLIDTQVKHLFLTYRATTSRPAGEISIARLYPATAIRKKGLLYAAQFLKRYAQPYVIGKLSGTGTSEGFVDKLYSFLNGGAITVGSEDAVEIAKLDADGSAFRRMEMIANARIQKYLLGRVKTSDLETGSRAAQETEEKTRDARMDAYLLLLAQAIQHAVDALILVNEAYGLTISAPAGLWFEFEDAIKVDELRAQRDEHYLRTGQVRFTKDYYTDILGFEEHHVELLEPQPNINSAQFSAKLADGVEGTQFQLQTPQTDEQKLLHPKMAKIMALLSDSDSYADFEEKLKQEDLSESDEALISALMLDGVKCHADGLLGQKFKDHSHD